jgi:hypothetical protein
MIVWLFVSQVKDLVWLLVKIMMAICVFLSGYGYYCSIFLEGFTLFILAGRFLIVVRVTLSSCIRAAMWLLCMLFGFPFGRYVFSRVMVMGLFTWSWDYFHHIGINVSPKLVIGWPLCQDI